MRQAARTIAGVLLTAVLTVGAMYGCAAREGRVGDDGKRWYRGNTHTHTLWSDGDAAPDWVTAWYVENGYDFLVLSDHNILQDGEKWLKIGEEKLKRPHVERLKERFGPAAEVRGEGDDQEIRLKTLEELRAQFEQEGRFILITGEEISDKVAGKPIHHNSINQYHLLRPPGGKTVKEAMRNAIRLVQAEAFRTGRAVMVHLNHPNFHYAVTPDDLAEVFEERFFEVYNGHRGVANYGDKDHMSTEQMWDYVLSLRLGVLGGPVLYGLATDDAHDHHGTQETANPGRGWVMVRAAELTPESVTRAMLEGDFYSSSGVTLEEVNSDGRRVELRIEAHPGITYTTRFIGTRTAGKTEFGQLEIGEVLKEVTGPRASYAFAGDELYVRAVVESSESHPNGYDPADRQTAWTQPFRPLK